MSSTFEVAMAEERKTDTNIIALSKVTIKFFFILPDCVLSITNDEFYLKLKLLLAYFV